MYMCKETVKMRLEEVFGWTVENVKIMDRFIQLDKGVSRVGFQLYVELPNHLYELTMYFNNDFTITFTKNFEEVLGIHNFRRYLEQE